MQIITILPLSSDDKIYLLEKLIEAGADINFSEPSRAPFVLLKGYNNENDIVIYQYLLSKNIDLTYYLFYNIYDMVSMTNFRPSNMISKDKNTGKILSSIQYKEYREYAYRRVFEAFKSYEISDFDKKEIILVAKFLIYTEDFEFLNLFINKGLLNLEKSLKSELISYALQLNSKDILKHIKE